MFDSLKKNKYGIILMALSSIFVCIGQLFWKLSTEQGVVALLFGFVLYVIGAIIMIVAYKFGSLSVLQPILSLNYVFSIILGAMILHESFSVLKLIGIIIIIIGVILIAGGDN